MDRLDPETLQSPPRKVPEVKGHDRVCPAENRYRQDMAVVIVGQLDSRQNLLVPGNGTFRNVCIHQVPGAFKLGLSQVGTVFQQIRHPLLVDSLGLTGSKKAAERQLHQQVAQRGRVKYTRIQNDRERARHFVARIAIRGLNISLRLDRECSPVIAQVSRKPGLIPHI